MDGHRASQRHHTGPEDEARALREFLTRRLTEDLTRLWDRDRAHGVSPHRPGLPAQVAALDQALATLKHRALPDRWELGLLLYGYGRHPDFDPAWGRFLEN